MDSMLTPLIFLGSSASSPEEDIVHAGQRAITLDLLSRLLRTPGYGTPIVATSDSTICEVLSSWPVIVDPDPPSFHFGRRLAELVRRYSVERPFYVGGGSGPLLTDRELTLIRDLVMSSDGIVVANNFFSVDFAAFSPGSAIEKLDPPAIDNDLGFLLHQQAGLRNVPLERTIATQFDVDTPIDLAILTLCQNTGPRTADFCRDRHFDVTRLRAAMRCFVDGSKELLVAGRVGSHALAKLETELACRKRVFSEERGMRASGREARGEVRSVLGYLVSALGPRQFFDAIAEMCDVAMLDTRVVFNHLHLNPTAPDRFNSDLLAAEAIRDPWLRDFTAAARDAPVPVLLGGHTLVCGGLWALVDAGWREHDLEVSATPT
jgi:hypothetical protein